MATSCVLWQDSEQTVTLIDIPRSIEAAQGLAVASGLHRIKSARPLQEPFPSHEPKTPAAKARLAQTSDRTPLDDQHHRLLHDALQRVRSEYTGPWCLPRIHHSDSKDVGEAAMKRKFGHSDQVLHPSIDCPIASLDGVLQDLCFGTQGITSTLRVPPEISGNFSGESSSVDLSSQLCLELVTNVSQHPATLTVKTSGKLASEHSFRIPPCSSFFLGNCENSRPFHTATRNQAQETGARRQFDLILMDPPWPNRSVKRTTKTPGSTYKPMTWLGDTRDFLLSMDLDLLLGNNSLLGIWITNKPAIRRLILEENGIFDCLGVVLEEEWIWLKTTTRGHTVFPLDSMWRKPYEILLLGRKLNWLEGVTRGSTEEIKRRTIIGVPDIHSRKPCLKELLEPKLPQTDDYRALEIFARYLISGWHSWGDQCIKYNSTDFWQAVSNSDTDGDAEAALPG